MEKNKICNQTCQHLDSKYTNPHCDLSGNAVFIGSPCNYKEAQKSHTTVINAYDNREYGNTNNLSYPKMCDSSCIYHDKNEQNEPFCRLKRITIHLSDCAYMCDLYTSKIEDPKIKNFDDISDLASGVTNDNTIAILRFDEKNKNNRIYSSTVNSEITGETKTTCIKEATILKQDYTTTMIEDLETSIVDIIKKKQNIRIRDIEQLGILMKLFIKYKTQVNIKIVYNNNPYYTDFDYFEVTIISD